MIKLIINATLLDETLTGIGQYQYNVLKRLSKEESIIEMKVLLTKSFVDSNFGVEFCDLLKRNNSKIQIVTVSSNKIFFRINSLLGIYLENGYIYHDLSFNSALGKKAIAKIVTFHDAFFLDQNLNNKKYSIANFNGKFILPWSARNADHLVVHTQVVKELLVKGLDLSPNKITVVPMGNPADEDEQISEKSLTFKDNIVINGTKITKPYFLTVGAGHSRKRTKDVIKASLKVTQQHQVVITGKNASEEHEVIKLSNENNKVKLLNFVTREQLLVLYKNASGLFFPSSEEGFGFPIIEALKYQIPVFASDIEVFKEVGSKYINYFKIGDIDKIAYYMEQLLDRKILANDENEINNWLRRYTWDNYIYQIMGIYLNFYQNDSKRN